MGEEKNTAPCRVPLHTFLSELLTADTDTFMIQPVQKSVKISGGLRAQGWDEG